MEWQVCGRTSVGLRRVLRGITAVSALLLVACASAPPAPTAPRVADIDAATFAAADADAVRVRLTLPADFVPDPARSALAIGVASPAGPREASCVLEQELRKVETTPGGLFRAPEPRSTYTLRLGDAAKAIFRELQASAAQMPGSKVTIDVLPRIAHRPSEANTVTASAGLLLDPAQGYLLLLDDARIPLPPLPARKTPQH